MRERLNWWIVIPVTIVGAALVVGGVVLPGLDKSTIGSLLVEVGVSFGLLGFLAAIEPRLRARIQETTRRAVREETAVLTSRVERLEDLQVAQDEARRRRAADQDEAIRRLRTDNITTTSVGQLLAAGHEERLLDDYWFKVRSSDRRDAHVLHYLPLVSKDGAVSAVWIDFEPMTVSGPPDAELNVQLPQRGESTVRWTVDEPASAAASELEAGLQRRNEPLNGFSFAYAIEQLAASVEVMRAARRANPTSGQRFEGTLRMLVNERWAYTSKGLEAVFGPYLFKVVMPGRRIVASGVASYWPGAVHDCERPSDEPAAEWHEAIEWLRDRERFEILGPGEVQTDPAETFLRRAFDRQTREP